MLIAETPVAVLRRFLATVSGLPDLPANFPANQGDLDEEGVKDLASNILRQKKSDAYATLLIEHCNSEQELPVTIVAFLMEVYEQVELPTVEEADRPDDGRVEATGADGRGARSQNLVQTGSCMPFEIGEKRQAAIDAEGHVLVLGGPGAGKTTLALLKAKRLLALLKPGQKVLFLSFSRAAVQQIVARCRDVLAREERKLIDVRTYHAFCWDLIQCHGRALCGIPLSMMRPGDEGRARTRFEGDWAVERRRLFDDESHVCFDLFAHAAARLIEESQHLCHGIADLYPLIILDEFQDTDDDQWRLTKALANATTAMFLADAEQRIYDFRPGVRPDRIDLLRAELHPAEFDLEADNYRSGGSQIVAFANAVLRGEGPLPRINEVVLRHYARYPNSFNSMVHFCLGNALSTLRQQGFADPTIAVLAPSNDLIADVSDILTQTHGFNGAVLQPIDHDVVWDAELSATAAVAVAAALEYVSAPSPDTQRALLLRVSDYWLVK